MATRKPRPIHIYETSALYPGTLLTLSALAGALSFMFKWGKPYGHHFAVDVLTYTEENDIKNCGEYIFMLLAYAAIMYGANLISALSGFKLLERILMRIVYAMVQLKHSFDSHSDYGEIGEAVEVTVPLNDITVNNKAPYDVPYTCGRVTLFAAYAAWAVIASVFVNGLMTTFSFVVQYCIPFILAQSSGNEERNLAKDYITHKLLNQLMALHSNSSEIVNQLTAVRSATGIDRNTELGDAVSKASTYQKYIGGAFFVAAIVMITYHSFKLHADLKRREADTDLEGSMPERGATGSFQRWVYKLVNFTHNYNNHLGALWSNIGTFGQVKVGNDLGGQNMGTSRTPSQRQQRGDF